MGSRMTVTRAAAAALALVAGVGLMLGAGEASASALRRGDRAERGCLRRFVEGWRVQTALDELVSDGTLTAAQEQAIVDKLEGGSFRNAPCTGLGLLRDRAVGNAIADLLGKERREIRQAWAGGQSLTEIAAGRGVSRDELIQTIRAAIDRRLQTAVDRGRISAERKTAIMGNIDPKIEAAVDTHRGDRRDDATPAATPVTPAASGGSTSIASSLPSPRRRV